MDRRLIRDLDILTLQLFVAICEEGTLTRAARREAIAPSAVSKRLADLECALHAELFHRLPNGMILTSAGQTMLHHSRSMLQNIESVGLELKEYARGIRGYVRVRANISAIVQFLPEDLKSFLSLHPEIRIDLEERTSRATMDDVERGAADIGICSSDVDSPHMTRAAYQQDRLVLVVDESHSLARRQEVRFVDTLEFDHIGLHADSAIYALLSASARLAAVPLRLKIHVPGFDALCRMVQAKLGIGIIPNGAFALIGRPMGLKAVQLTDEWAQRELRVVHRGEQTLSAAGRLLVRHLTNARWLSDIKATAPTSVAAQPDPRNWAGLKTALQ